MSRQQIIRLVRNIHQKSIPSVLARKMATITEIENDLKLIKEGKAEAFQPASVFYNPVQEFNRDVTIAVLTQFSQEFHNKSSTVSNKTSSVQSSAVDTSEQSSAVDTSEQSSAVDTSEQSSAVDTSEQVVLNKSDASEEKVSSATHDNDVTMTDNTAPKVGVKSENGIRILEGLAASGLRSMRFGLELPGVKEIVCNDFSRNAVEIMEKNIEHNHLEELVKSNLGDAAMLIHQNKGIKNRFDVIDIDPYGSPVQFLDSAVQGVKDGGMLCVTCTDMAVLCGNAKEKCHSSYGSLSLKTRYCHEMALRILLQCLESHANRYHRYIEPIISLSVDFYIRVFVKLNTGLAKVRESASKVSMIYQCVGCGSFTLQKLADKVNTKGGNFTITPAHGPPVGATCEHCNSKHVIGGPIWSEPIHNAQFIQNVLDNVSKNMKYLGTADRIIGLLSVAKEELPDVPLHHVLDDMCKAVQCAPPSMKIARSAILNGGYRVSLSHTSKNSYKTDAPHDFLWDIFRTWVIDNPVKEQPPGSVSRNILEKPIKHDISLTPHPDANPTSREQRLLRWQPNPEVGWGPKPRPNKNKDDKREKFQGKRKQKESSSVDRKKYPCKRFKRGECDLGDDCHYNHIIEEPTI